MMSEQYEGLEFAQKVVKLVIENDAYKASDDLEDIVLSGRMYSWQRHTDLDDDSEPAMTITWGCQDLILKKSDLHKRARAQAQFMKKALLYGTLSTYKTQQVYFKPFTADESDDLIDMCEAVKDEGILFGQDQNMMSIMNRCLARLSEIKVENGEPVWTGMQNEDYPLFRRWLTNQIGIGYWNQNDPAAIERPSDSHVWLKLFNQIMAEKESEEVKSNKVWFTAYMRRMRARQAAHMEKAKGSWRLVADDEEYYNGWREDLLKNYPKMASWLAKILKEL